MGIIDDEANAAHIVRCVNSFDALVAACRAARRSSFLSDEIQEKVAAALKAAAE